MNGDNRMDIRSLSREELERFFLEHSEKKFRSSQAYNWIWQQWCQSFGEMTNLPKSTRQLLADHFDFRVALLSLRQKSADGTVKVIFKLHDGLIIEGVLIPAGERFTACISSQAGCALACRFCATGQLGFKRNLTAWEIVDQVVQLARIAGNERKATLTPGEKTDDHTVTGSAFMHQLSNIVFMGMGEPLMNYENVTIAISAITAVDGLGVSPQRITLSSVGIPKMIRKMADDNPKYHFALSLHAPTDAKRDLLIPMNRKHPLKELIEALKYYHQKTHKRISIEYILFRNLNDTSEDVRELARFCKNFPVKINLMAYNQVKDTGLFSTSPEGIRMFAEKMKQFNLVVNVRNSRGADIAAACGQLAGALKAADIV